MSDLVLASELLRELSEPWASGERIKSVIDRTARMARLQYWRTFDLWYRKARTVEEYELDQIREALRIKNERAARNELQQAKLILARLEARLNSGDTDFYRADIDGLREATSRMGGSNSAGRR
ncbi:hypothetical protein JQ628_11445 [Bradyrhizobium lablabi]|uniref:hypothetical protein n=1 Tax=Bradyrhizobium lablabi TaxID=722472 RepID=UPI001BA7DB51|nr:hypothetical protein [Bradyrhizobium lablabi]MBR1122130.1 hypothetical protein [Bradyrhizobium lablabi]